MTIKTWNIEQQTGYKPITTFYEDFSIADAFGKEAIVDTFARAFEEWKGDYRYLTELVMVVNWKSWEHANNKEYCELYSNLYYKADEYALDNLKGKELDYYFKVTD